MGKFPTFSQWKQIFKVLRKGEKIFFVVFFILAIASLFFLVNSFYLNNTKVVPTLGGTYIEGIVGQPRFINPIYGETNDVDRTLIDLVFSGLVTYDKNGQIVKDLAANYTVSDDGKTYDFQLKNNIFWHDGQPLTADDIIFTVQTIQNSDYKSPLRANWIDVEVQKISDTSVRFNLKTPYNSFLENCVVKIIPKHIWQNISPENFALSYYNLQPIGSGPFQFVSISQAQTGFITKLNLASNRRYYNSPSFISNISFHFFEKKEDLIASANAKEINGFTLASLDNNETTAKKDIPKGWLNSNQFNDYSFLLPRYFAVFLNNQKSSIFSDPNVRQALTFATNKDELVKKISSETKTSILKVDSPILPDFFNYQAPSFIYTFDTTKAKSLLDKSGFKDNGSGGRAKAIVKKPAFQFASYLKVGSKGKEVTQLQGCLVKLPDVSSGSFSNLLKGEVTGTYGKGTENAMTEFQKKYLPDAKPTGETGAATRQQLNQLCFGAPQTTQPLAFTLTTVNQPQLLEVANMLQSYWQSVGFSVTIEAVSITDLKPIIKDRSYDALLYGEALGAEPDLYPFWHSSQKVDPGLNLSSYENKNVDQLVKDARETLDGSVKEQKLQQLQNIIISDAPALFLYNPDYRYWVSPSVQGIESTKIIDPAKRFENITQWFIQTKRVWR